MNVKNIDPESSQRLPETDVAILGLLTEKPSYGYEIEQRVSSRGMRNWTRMEQSSIYNSLRRLERNGLVESVKKEVDGRLRKIYHPTSQGSHFLQREVFTYLSIPAKELTNFDLGLANIYALSWDKAVEALARYLTSLEEGIDFLDSSAKAMRRYGIPIAAWLIERPLVDCRARAQWIKDFLEELKHTPFPGESDKKSQTRGEADE
jgi:DNA-binding PadR family transcriptional regulator